MARKIQVSFKELTTGSYFSIVDPTGDAETIKIDVVDSDPILFQVINTDDVPIDTRTEVSMQRVSDELQSSTFVTNVSYEGTLMTIEVSDPLANQIDLTWSGSFRFVSITIQATDERLDKDNETGGGQDYTGELFEPFINNIRIDGINQQLISFSNYPTRGNVAANFGDYVQTRIVFTSAEPLSSTDSVKFYFGYIEKDENPYSNVDDYQIDINKFKDPYQNTVTQFNRDIPSTTAQFFNMNHTSPKWGQYGGAQIYDYGVDNQYQIRFNHYIPFLPREDDYDLKNYTIPEDVNGGKTLKPIFQIDIISDKAANAPEQSTNRTDLTNFFDRGSVGFYDQVFQTGDKFYSLTEGSLVFNNGTIDVDKIDSSRDTTVSFTIEMDDGTTLFTADDEIILHIQDVNLATSEAAKRKTFTDNQRYDSVLINTNNSPGSSTRITQFKAEINSLDNTKIDCTAVIPKLQVTDFYNLWCSVSRSYLNTTPLMTAQNIYLQSEVAEAGGDKSVIRMDFFNTNAQRIDYNIYPHWQTKEEDISGTFNEVRGFPEDVLAAKFRIVNDDAANTILTSFKVRIKGSESGIIYDGDFKFDIVNGSVRPRGWKLEQQFQNEVTFTPNYGFEAGKDEYLINYAFMIDPSWSGIDDMVIEWIATYDQTLDDGTEVSFSVGDDLQSAPFKHGFYDQTENTSLEPQTLNPSGKLEFFDESTGNKVSKIIEEPGAKTRIKYTFEEENLNDLQAVPATPRPYPFLLSTRTEGNLTGYLDLVPQGGGATERWRFHNFEENTPSFWESVPEHPDTDYARIIAEDVDTATIEAIIDGSKFINEFNKIPTCYDFSARIDKVQTAPAGLSVNTDIYVVIDTTSFLGQSSAGIAEARVNNWFLEYVRQTRLAGDDFVGNLYKIYPQSSNFGATQHGMERWIGFVMAAWENEELIDFENRPGYPVGSNDTTWRQSYAPGLVTVMRSVDIDVNGIGTTVVRGDSSDVIINPGTLNVYYNSFFDDSNNHLEHILDFWSSGSVRTLTFNGVPNRTTVNSTANTDVIKFNSPVVNPSFNKSLLTFQGINNDYSFDFGSGVEVVTPSKDCLFIHYIDDTVGINGAYEAYSLRTTSAITLASTFEATAINNALSTGDPLSTWIFRQDHDYYFNNILPNLNAAGNILYCANGDINRASTRTQGMMCGTHIQVLRALKGSSITFAEMKESTFLNYYDTGLEGSQAFASLQLLDASNGGNTLVDNTTPPLGGGYNDMQNKGFTAVLDFGDYVPTDPLWSNTTTYQIGEKVTQSLGTQILQYTSLTNSNLNNSPSSNPTDWVATEGAGFMGSVSQSQYNSQITNAINQL